MADLGSPELAIQMRETDEMFFTETSSYATALLDGEKPRSCVPRLAEEFLGTPPTRTF
jgi:hypothetical protein